VQSGPGRITVDFAPAAGAQPTEYRLADAPSGADVQPAKVGPGGPFTFVVIGGDCDNEYTFRVVARYQDGRTARSPQSAPVRPCVVPGAPQSFKATPIAAGGHGVDLSWKPPANAAGSNMTYKLTWTGGSSGATTATGTSKRVTGLINSKKYVFTLTASNAAGSGTAEAAASADLTPPSRTINVTNNWPDGVDLGVRNQPSSVVGGRATFIPAGENPPVTAHCQTRGTREVDTHDADHYSDVWDKVTYNGIDGWISDIWMDTSNHLKNSTFSPELWQCT
jgi:hypothetical protein